MSDLSILAVVFFMGGAFGALCTKAYFADLPRFDDPTEHGIDPL